MTPSVPDPDPTAIAARLRAAGCVFAEDETRLLIESARTATELEAMIGRRVGGEPLEYVVGWVNFAGLRIGIERGVFVPRQRTEFLVRTAAGLATGEHPVAVDLCCGSGALGAALVTLRPGLALHACDIDPVAVACAARNVEPLGGHAYAGDLFDALPAGLRGRIDVLLANVPYVPTAAIAGMPPEARDHEPRSALDGGGDGLYVLRRVAAQAPQWLAPGGHVLFEIAEAQRVRAMEAANAAGLTPSVRSSRKYAATVLIGRSDKRGELRRQKREG